MRTKLSKFIDPELLSRIKFLDIRARLIVESLYAGLHKSHFQGFSVEFSSHREYIPGDPLKLIDWKVYARTKKLYIKLFHEDTSLKAMILLDHSASMDYGEKGFNKLFYAKTLGASLAYLLIKQKDNAGIVTFSKNITSILPPSSGSVHLKNLLIQIERSYPEKGRGFSQSVVDLLSRIKRRMLYIVISDFLDDPIDTRRKLVYLKKSKNEVIVFHILHREEVSPDFTGIFKFYDPDSGRTMVSGSEVLKKGYITEMRRYLLNFSKEMSKHGIDYYLVITDTPFEFILTEFLERRKKLW